MYLELLNNLANWEFCKSDQTEEDEGIYQFGWKGGLHCYLYEKFLVDVDRFFLVCYLNKKIIHVSVCSDFSEVTAQIKKLL